MNNHIPDAGKMVCPKCGSEVLNPEGSQRYYYCGSTMESGDQSAICVTRQRDQLRARVEELEGWIGELSETIPPKKKEGMVWASIWTAEGSQIYVGKPKPEGLR